MVSKIYLALNAVAIGLVGLFYLYDPNILLSQYGLKTGSTGLDNMFRSAYGGVFLAAATVFLLGVFQPGRRKDAVGFVTLFMIGAAVGRLASIAAVGMPPMSIMPLLGYECLAAVIGLFLYFRFQPQ